jgi:hypothetical protein
MLEVNTSAQELPIRVLDELLCDRLILFIKEVLEIMQAHHQARRQSGTPDLFGVERAELRLESSPVNRLG